MKLATFATLSILALVGCQSKGGGNDPSEAGSASGSVAQVYRCPMHPQIVQDHPGECPICGMDLVKGTSPAVEDGHDHTQTGGDAKAAQVYRCPMHPQIVQDHPGECPICGMDLVKATGGSVDDESSQDDSYVRAGAEVRIEPSVVQKIGVRTEMVEIRSVGRAIESDAEGVLDEAAERSVTVRSMGYLESVSSVREGDPVRSGQVLASFYSPDLVAAQGDWLSALRVGDSSGAQAARSRLVALGFPEGLFAKIRSRAEPLREIPVVSPVRGWIRKRSAVSGQALMSGTEVFRIVKGDGTLLEARLPASQARHLRKGDLAMVEGDGMDSAAMAKVERVLPEVLREGRTVRVRFAPDRGFSPVAGAFYRVRLSGTRETGTVVPSDAVLHSGKRDVVFLDLGNGKYRPVEVKVGPSADGLTLVRQGVEAGDEVVVSAQFLLDSESRLQSALDQLISGSKAATDPHAGHGGM